MLYYLGSHRWLWGRGGVGVSARERAASGILALLHPSLMSLSTARSTTKNVPLVLLQGVFQITVIPGDNDNTKHTARAGVL